MGLHYQYSSIFSAEKKEPFTCNVINILLFVAKATPRDALHVEPSHVPGLTSRDTQPETTPGVPVIHSVQNTTPQFQEPGMI